jgi:transposase-like protein
MKAGGAFIMSGKKGMKHYPKAVKLAVWLFYEEGKIRAEITEALGLRREERVKIWARQYRREGADAFSKPKGRPRKEPESEKAELERLRMENALLKKYHTDLRAKRLVKHNIGSSTTTEKNTQ